MRFTKLPTIHSLLPLVLLCACGGTNGVKPDDMSAEAHRREAEREQARADEHAARTHPTNVHGTPDRPLTGGGPEDYIYPARVYNPDDYHLREAERHRTHAAEHEAAAAELERFEEAECKDLPPRTRASCPLLGPATAIVDIPDGVRIDLAEGVNVPAVVAVMRCHYAYARARGFGQAAGCPLYVRGIEIQSTLDGKGVQITSKDAATVKLVRQRAREEAAPAAPTTL